MFSVVVETVLSVITVPFSVGSSSGVGVASSAAVWIQSFISAEKDVDVDGPVVSTIWSHMPPPELRWETPVVELIPTVEEDEMPFGSTVLVLI